MREDVKKALDTARALPEVASDNTYAINQRLTQLETLCNGLPDSARSSFIRHLAHEGLIELDIELDTEMLLSLSFLTGNNFNGLHGVEILRARGVEEVAKAVEDHTLSVFVRLFGMEGIVHLNDELQAKGKRQCLEGELGL